LAGFDLSGDTILFCANCLFPIEDCALKTLNQSLFRVPINLAGILFITASLFRGCACE